MLELGANGHLEGFQGEKEFKGEKDQRSKLTKFLSWIAGMGNF